MVSGSCLCANVKVEFEDAPEAHITGAGFSDNIVIDDAKFKILSETEADNEAKKGTPKEFLKTADSGRPITSHFCGDCGTTLFRTGVGFPGKHVVKAGIINDPAWQNSHIPQGELYAPERLAWVPQIKDAPQMNNMP